MALAFGTYEEHAYDLDARRHDACPEYGLRVPFKVIRKWKFIAGITKTEFNAILFQTFIWDKMCEWIDEAAMSEDPEAGQKHRDRVKRLVDSAGISFGDKEVISYAQFENALRLANVRMRAYLRKEEPETFEEFCKKTGYGMDR